MARLLFFLEPATVERSRETGRFSPALSHDAHLGQLIDAALVGGHDVYIASLCAARADLAPTSLLLSLAPFRLAHGPALRPAGTRKPDAVFTVYPDWHRRDTFPHSQLVTYFPALYFVEMPDHYSSGRLATTLSTACYHTDAYIFQNGRQQEFMRTLCLAFGGKDISTNSHLLPLGIGSEDQREPTPDRESARAALGLKTSDIALIHGGGAWRWSDFDTFLQQFIAYVGRNPHSRLKLLIPGLSQGDNHDHDAYILKVRATLDNHSLLLANKNSDQWRILFLPSWEEAQHRLPELYAASDLGVSVSPPSFEYYLSHRVRVVSYLQHGLGLILARGDSFSCMKPLEPIRHVADTSNKNAYDEVFQHIDKSDTRHQPDYYQAGRAARTAFCNLDTKVSAISRLVTERPRVEARPSPMAFAFHEAKVSSLKAALRAALLTR